MFDKTFGRKILSLLLILGLLAGIPQSRARADSAEFDPPDGFRRVDDENGVELYRKDYPGGTPDYVQVLYLDQGARLKLLSGRVTEDRVGQGAFGGSDARILSQTLQKFWTQVRGLNRAAFCVTNGTFFYMKESPTRLPLPLKIDGRLLTEGYARDEFVGEKLMLELWDDRANIVELSKNALHRSSAPDILGGLHEDAEKASKKFVGRTFVGVMDGDQDGAFEVLLIFNTQSARASDAGKVLKRFGAQKVMMLDGGGSTQLICKGKTFIASERLIPQALAVLYVPPKNKSTDNLQAVADPAPSQHAEMVSAAEEIPPAQPDGADASDSVQTTEQASRAQPVVLTAGAGSELRGTLRLGDVAWVPAGMFPVMVLLMLAIARRREV